MATTKEDQEKRATRCREIGIEAGKKKFKDIPDEIILKIHQLHMTTHGVLVKECEKAGISSMTFYRRADALNLPRKGMDQWNSVMSVEAKNNPSIINTLKENGRKMRGVKKSPEDIAKRLLSKLGVTRSEWTEDPELIKTMLLTMEITKITRQVLKGVL